MRTASDDRGLVRLALWASLMMPIKDAGMSRPGFSSTDAEWKQMAALAAVVEPGIATRFKIVNAIVFIVLAALLVGGGFVPLLSALYPNPADTRPLPFALLLSATALLALGIGLPLAMRVAAWLVAGGLRSRLTATPETVALRSKVTGLNVAMVAVPDGQFTMSGQGQWTRQVNDGKTFQFAEVGRDASSVTLNDTSRGIKVILDLSQRKVLLVASNGTTRPIFRIVNAAAK